MKIPIIFCIVFVISHLHARDFESKHFEIQKLSEGVYAVIAKAGGGAICNAGIVDIGGETIVFDTFLSPAAARDLKAATQQLTSSPIRYAVNSHGHNDHIRGNVIFRDEAEIISTSAVRKAIAENEPGQIEQEKRYAPAQLAKMRSEVEAEQDDGNRQEALLWLGYYEAMVESHRTGSTVLPSLTFEDRMVLYGVNRTVELIEYADGHTASDVIMVLPEERIVFTGDLLFIDFHPYLADGDPAVLHTILEQMAGMGIRTIVPGHGSTGSRDDILNMIRYLETIDCLARDFSARGKGMDELGSIQIPEAYSAWSFPHFFEINMRYSIENALKRSAEGIK